MKARPLNGEEKALHARLMEFEDENCKPAKIGDAVKMAAASKRMILAGYSFEQIVACYGWLSRQQFWKDKHISLAIISSQMPSFFKATEIKEGPPIGYIPDDSPAFREHLERRTQEESLRSRIRTGWLALSQDERDPIIEIIRAETTEIAEARKLNLACWTQETWDQHCEAVAVRDLMRNQTAE